MHIRGLSKGTIIPSTTIGGRSATKVQPCHLKMAVGQVRVGYPQVSGLAISVSGSGFHPRISGSDTQKVVGLGWIFSFTRGSPFGA